MKKEELRAEFNKWLGDEFDAQNKVSDGQSNRYIFCNDGMDGIDDCACNMIGDELEKCECICHERISQIVDFFWKRLRRRK